MRKAAAKGVARSDMGYPMTYSRLVRRNFVTGNYGLASEQGGYDTPERRMLAGDMRRFEHDVRDAMHIAMLAEYAGVTNDQARMIVNAVLGYENAAAVFFEMYGPEKVRERLVEDTTETPDYHGGSTGDHYTGCY